MALTQDPAQNPTNPLFSQKTTDAQTGEGQGWERPVIWLNPPRKAPARDSEVTDKVEGGREASHPPGPMGQEVLRAVYVV